MLVISSPRNDHSKMMGSSMKKNLAAWDVTVAAVLLAGSVSAANCVELGLARRWP